MGIFEETFGRMEWEIEKSGLSLVTQSMSKKNVGVQVGTPDQVEYKFFSYDIGDLEGKVMTFVDAATQDIVQRKAMKDILRQTIWAWASSNNSADWKIQSRTNLSPTAA